MKSRTPLLARLWRKLFPEKPKQPPVRLSSQAKPLPKSDRLRERGIEPLEGRIAPAVLLPNGLDVQYKDADGDLVTIHFSKQIFIAAPGGSVDTLLSSVFTFSNGSAHTGAPVDAQDGLQQLQTIDLTKVRPNASSTPATGVSMTITAQKIDSNNDGMLEGDGLVNIGAISAAGIALGSVSVGGDLGQIDAGLSTAAVALQSLTVKTLGAKTDTQAGTASYESTMLGGIGTFTADSIVGGYLHVTSSTSGGGSGTAAVGNIGTLTVKHFLGARDAATATATNDGRIEVAGNIGTLLIGSGELSDGLNGGAGASSGSIKVGGNVTKLLVKGDLRGATGTSSASIDVDGQIMSLQVDGTLLGSGTTSASITGGKLGTVVIGKLGSADPRGLVGGAGDGSAVVKSESTIGSAVITNIQGGGPNSGGLTAASSIGPVTVNGFVKGGTGLKSGFIHSDFSLSTVKLTGNLEGGTGDSSGVVSSAGNLTSFSGAGIIGDGLDSGGVKAGGKIMAITLTGSLIGGADEHSGFLDSDFSIGTITIKGDVDGRAGVKSGTIVSASSIGTINIGGHLKGGDVTVTPATGSTPESIAGGDLSGSITAGVAGIGGITSLTIGEGIIGGSAIASGMVSSFEKIGKIIVSSSEGHALTGGAGATSGSIYSFGDLGTVTLNGDIRGGEGQNSGTVQAHGLISALTTTAIVGGAGEGSGAVLALDQGIPGGDHKAGKIGTMTVSGFVKGGDGLRSGVVNSDGAIGSLTIGQLLAGGNPTAGRVVSGAGLYDAGNITTLTIGNVGAQNFFGEPTADYAGGTVLAYGAVGTLKLQTMYQGTIHVMDSIGSLTLGSTASLNGTLKGMDSSTITAGGQAVFNGKTDLAIGSITIYGDVTNSSIKAGYGILDDAQNGHAQIGAVKVTGNWLSSSLVAGVQDAGATGFGDAGDQLIPGNTSSVKARIASVLITGNVDTTGSGQFGFVAQEIGSFKSNRGMLALSMVAGQSFEYAGANGGTTSIREVLPLPI